MHMLNRTCKMLPSSKEVNVFDLEEKKNKSHAEATESHGEDKHVHKVVKKEKKLVQFCCHPSNCKSHDHSV